MQCREVRQLAEAFVSEQLPVVQTRALAAHLYRCAACQTEVEGLRRLRASIRLAFGREPDLAAGPAFAAALASRVRAQAAPRLPARTRRLRWLPVAAGILLVIGAGWGWREWSALRLVAVLHAAVGDHRFCALTFRLDERPIPLSEAARRYDPVNERLETIEPSASRLSGGPLRILERHSCVYDGRRFAHIVLRYKKQTASLLMTDDPRAGGWLGRKLAAGTQTPSLLPVTDGFHVVSLQGPRHLVFVVSSLSDDDLQEVARAMAGPVSQALTGG